jgi:hypothetical protein
MNTMIAVESFYIRVANPACNMLVSANRLFYHATSNIKNMRVSTKNDQCCQSKNRAFKNKLLSAVMLIAVLLSSLFGWSQTSVQNFGTGSGTHTSSTGSTSFIPVPTAGTTWARAGATVPNAPINLVNTTNLLGSTGSYLRATASATTSVAKNSPWINYGASTEFYTSLK